uniref:Uncharacterized protein n=1 Tax=Oryza barthii TaxID=65489 RepID=A0A0D3HKC1_9ORYZ
MDQAPYIAGKDLPKITPTKCSTICSSSDTKPDHTVATVVTCATLAMSSIELVAIDDTNGSTNIDTPDSTKAMPANCSTVGLDVKGGTDHARVTCQTMMGVVLPDASSEVFSPWLIAEMDLVKLMPTWCLMKCLKAYGWSRIQTQLGKGTSFATLAATYRMTKTGIRLSGQQEHLSGMSLAHSDQDRHTVVRPARAFVRHELGIGNGSHILYVSEAGARCGYMRKLLELIRNEMTFQIKIMVENLLQEVNMISSFETSILEMNTHVLKYSASTQVLDAHALNICNSIGLLNLMTHKQLQCLLIHKTWKFLLSVIVVVHGSRGSSFKAGLLLCAISNKYLAYNSMAIWDTKLLGMTRKDQYYEKSQTNQRWMPKECWAKIDQSKACNFAPKELYRSNNLSTHQFILQEDDYWNSRWFTYICNILHRLKDKPNFKKRGLLGTQLGCIWAMLAILQAQPMETEERIQKAAAALLEASNRSISERRTTAATWWPVGTFSISFLPAFLLPLPSRSFWLLPPPVFAYFIYPSTSIYWSVVAIVLDACIFEWN